MVLSSHDVEHAQSRVGRTLEERLSWLLGFEALDPEKVTNWLSLGLQCVVFCSGKVADLESIGRKRPVLPRENQILEWQRGLRTSWQKLAKGEEWRLRVKGYQELSMRDGILVTITDLQSANNEYWPFHFTAVQLLLAAGTRFRVCDNPSCSRHFLGVRRQVYCSQRCRETVTKRVYRKRLKERTFRSSLLSPHKPR
jgi:hypothetical protein